MNLKTAKKLRKLVRANPDANVGTSYDTKVVKRIQHTVPVWSDRGLPKFDDNGKLVTTIVIEPRVRATVKPGCFRSFSLAAKRLFRDGAEFRDLVGKIK